MTQIPRDNAGAELNRYWKSQQPKPTAPPKQPDAPKEQTEATPRPQTTPAECVNCQFRKTECLTPMRLWSKHAPRPKLARAWAALIIENSGKMPCLIERTEAAS